MFHTLAMASGLAQVIIPSKTGQNLQHIYLCASLAHNLSVMKEALCVKFWSSLTMQ